MPWHDRLRDLSGMYTTLDLLLGMDNTKIQAKKYLGQNFLKNPDILNKIVGQNDLTNMHIIEVWPGPGDLTSVIWWRNPKSLALVELDMDMIELLTSRFSNSGLDIYHSDVLKIDVLEAEAEINMTQNIRLFDKEKIIRRPSYHLYWNIPYYITSPIIHHFFYETNLQPEVATFTMQKEVADRILARDGKHSVLSLHCQLLTDIEKVCDINPNSFTPAPKVWSTCLRFSFNSQTSPKDAKNIMKVVQLWFSQKRKKLISNLEWRFQKDHLLQAFSSLGISDSIRAEDLNLSDWKNLAKILLSL